MTSPREQFAAAKRANEGFFFPEKAIWSDGVERRFKVTDPNRSSADSPLKLSTSPLDASLRLVKFHPDDPQPQPGASVTSRNGLLVLGAYTDVGNLFGTRTGVCRLVDERLRTGLLDLPGRLNELTPPEMQAIFDHLGTPLELQRQSSAGEWTADARQQAAPTINWAGKGLLLPLSAQQAADVGSTTPTPLLRAYLPLDAPASEPGFVLVAPPSALTYAPVRDAIYWEGRCWEVIVAAPGERSQ